MRIAVVGNFGLTGKQTMAERALPLSEALASRGHALRVALPTRDAADPGGPVERNGVDIRFAVRGLFVPGVTHVWQALQLFWMALSWRPDIVYCFKPIAYSGAVLFLMRMARRLGLFRGALILDSDDWEGYGGWNEIQPFPGWLKRLIAWQEGWSLRHADSVTVASLELRDLAARAGARQVTYIPNAVRSCPESAPSLEAEALRARLGLTGRPVVLLYTRFFEFGLPRLIATLREVVKRVPEVSLLVVGRGFADEDRDLRQLAVGAGIEQSVVQAGWVEQAQLPLYFAAADVALYPLDDTLLNRSKCPAKLRDLLAAGVPVVADRVGQAREYITHEVTGVLVKPEDPREMAAATVALLENSRLRVEMGRAAVEDCRARWTWGRWAPIAEKALEEALAAARGTQLVHPG